ncbi:hypothetical protein [Novosphingobium lindaniclasticum]
MSMLRTVLVAAAGALALAGCVPQGGPQQPAQPAGNGEAGPGYSRDMSAADRTACEGSGGSVQRRGRLGMEQCVHAFADAGKQCTDSSQCQGKCIGSAGAASADASASGTCQADDRLFGCHAEIKGGKAVNAICID